MRVAPFLAHLKEAGPFLSFVLFSPSALVYENREREAYHGERFAAGRGDAVRQRQDGKRSAKPLLVAERSVDGRESASAVFFSRAEE